MNILEVVNSHDKLMNYYQVILGLCSNNNYEFHLEYKLPNDRIPNLGYFLDEEFRGVIKICPSLSYENKISCIAHELAHVELKFVGNTDEFLFQIDRITYPYDFSLLKGSLLNFLHHLLIDDILDNKQLSNQLYHTEILGDNIQKDFSFTLDEFYEGSSKEELINKMKNLYFAFKEVENLLSQYGGDYTEIDCSLLVNQYSSNIIEVVEHAKECKNLQEIENLTLSLIQKVRGD